MEIKFIYDNEQVFNKELEKLQKVYLHHEIDRQDSKYVIIFKTNVMEQCLETMNEILTFNLDNMEVGDKLIGDLVKKLLRIYNKAVLNEELGNE